MERGYLLCQSKRPIPLRVDRNEQRLHLTRIRPKRIHDFGNLQHGGRIDIGAVGEPEENQQVLAVEFF